MSKQSYVFGSKDTPIWYHDELRRGRIRDLVDDEGVRYGIVRDASTVEKVNVGDTIVKSFHGLSVIHKGAGNDEKRKESKSVQKDIEPIEEVETKDTEAIQ